MKLIVLLLLLPITTILIFLNSCTTSNKNYYEIKSNSEVIEPGGIYEAKIHLLKLNEIDQKIEPFFYIIINKTDTAYLPYDTDNHCATYTSTSNIPGTKTWNATFEYKTINGEDIKIEFMDSFTVK